MSTETKTTADELLEEALDTTKKKFESEEKPDLDKIEKRSPPKRGICRRCGEDKPVNRVMLCYPCWVITEIEDKERKAGREWFPGMPHPDWCHCEIPGAHPERLSSGN